MSRITTNLAGIERNLLNRLAESNAAAALASLRLATGHKINAPADDPAGFVTLSRFQSQFSLVQSTLGNVNAASSLVAQAQTTIGTIRSELESIRAELLKDADGELSDDERTAAQSVIDTALARINSYAQSEIEGRRLLEGSGDFIISGRNASQVASIEIFSTGGAGPLQVAAPAKLAYTGASRYVSAEAEVTFTGNRGSVTLAVSTDDTLESLAREINAQTHATGVVAAVADNTLTLASDTTGPRALVEVSVQSGTFAVTGGDGAGRASGSSALWSTTPRMIGEVIEAATQAELTYTGSSGQITADATFDVRGKLGSANVSVTTWETLALAAARINAQSWRTGVVAEVAGDRLSLKSVAFGGNAEVALSVSTGTFDVSGGDENGTARGIDAVATINGHLIQSEQAAELRHREKTGLLASGATVEITGHLGTASVVLNDDDSLAAAAEAINAQAALTGVTARVDANDLVLASTERGSASAIEIEVTSGTFDTVSGSSEAVGSAAVASIGRADGNRLSVNQSGFQFTLDLAAGFTGELTPMSVTGGGLEFALDTDPLSRPRLAIPSLLTAHFIGDSGALDDLASGGGAAGLGDNTARALRIVDESLGRLTRIEGTVDGFFRSAITSASGLLGSLQTDLQTAIDGLNKIDEEEETDRVAFYQDLADNAVAALNVLNQQRSGIVRMIQYIAGLD